MLGCTLLESGDTFSNGDAINSQDPAPSDIYEPRENATTMVLARNIDVKGTVSAIASLVKQWDKWYNYSLVFLNDEQWNPAFETEIRKVMKSELTFAQIPRDMWSWPTTADGRNLVSSRAAIDTWMESQGIPHVRTEGYHRMRRIYSSLFYDHPALKRYKYY